jgi:hypothetical protein
MKGRKVGIKYRDKEDNTWVGRGVQPVAVQQTAATRKAAPKKRRRKK